MVAGTTDYGVSFPSVVIQDNAIGTQFHPEKSGDLGLRLYDNFVRLCASPRRGSGGSPRGQRAVAAAGAPVLRSERRAPAQVWGARLDTVAASFEVIPAIDLRAGRAVRLYQGDYARETVYADDRSPWRARGRPAGAAPARGRPRRRAAGEPRHLAALAAIAAAVAIPVEFGGGVRSRASADAALAAGAERVIVGTAAIEDPALAQALAAALGPRLVLGVDARDGQVATRGWESASQVAAGPRGAGAHLGRAATDLHRHRARRHAHRAELRQPGRRDRRGRRCR